MLSERLIKTIAHIAHDAIRALNIENGSDPDLPLYEAISAEGKAALAERINTILTDPRAGDATFHNEWLAQMKKGGWAFGREFDEAAKLHPRMVPFHLLPQVEQDRERIFRAIVLQASRV